MEIEGVPECLEDEAALRDGAGAPREEASVGLPVVMARLGGALGVADTEELLNWMQPLCIVARRVILDLRAVDRIDPVGVRALLTLQEELLANEGELALVVQPDSRVARALARLHLDPGFPTCAGSASDWEQLLAFSLR